MTSKRIQSVKLDGIVKDFPGVRAVDHVDLTLTAGKIHALLGENGAGKSTLMKILYGLYKPDGGSIFINEQPVKIPSPTVAIEAGIGMIHQHFMLVPSLSATENVALGLPHANPWHLDRQGIAKRLRELSLKYNLQLDPDIPIWQLSVGERQRVEILRALYKNTDLLILDEPTAVLTPQEADHLFRTLRQMATDGHTLVFISHKLNEVLALTDEITVLRGGKHVASLPTSQATRSQLAELMVGHPVQFHYDQPQITPGTELLQLVNVWAKRDRGTDGLRGISLNVRAGEIVGIAGVSGNGQEELTQVINGLRPVEEGQIFINQVDVSRASVSEIKRLRVAYIPEERMVDGVVKNFTVAENYILRDYHSPAFLRWNWFLNRRKIATACETAIKNYAIKTPNQTTMVKNLSGGNIQKVVLARELATHPDLIIAAQPTRGVDIGAIEYIHQELLKQKARGVAILLISEDLDEILLLADRVLVMYEGQIVGEMHRDQISMQQLGAWMAGSTTTS